MEEKTIFPHPEQFSGYCQVIAAKKTPYLFSFKRRTGKNRTKPAKGRQGINHCPEVKNRPCSGYIRKRNRLYHSIYMSLPIGSGLEQLQNRIYIQAWSSQNPGLESS